MSMTKPCPMAILVSETSEFPQALLFVLIFASELLTNTYFGALFILLLFFSLNTCRYSFDCSYSKAEKLRLLGKQHITIHQLKNSLYRYFTKSGIVYNTVYCAYCNLLNQ